MTSDKPLTLTIKEAAKLSRLSTHYLYRLSAQGVLPTIKVGKKSLVPYDEFKDWLFSQKRVGITEK